MGPHTEPPTTGAQPMAVSPPPMTTDTGIYGDLDKAYQPPRDPLTRPANPEIIYRDIPVSVALNWDPVSVGEALTSHLTGFFTGSALLVDALLGDPRVQATLMTRTAALFGQPVKHKAADKDTNGKVRDAWVEAWGRIGESGVLQEILRWQILMGFSIVEPLWDTSVEPWIPVLKPWNPQFSWYNIVTRRYIAITYDGNIDVSPGDGKWCVYAPHGDYRAWVHGCVRSIAGPWLNRQYALRDWARYSEVHGIPIIKAMVPAVGDALQKQGFQNSLGNLGSQSVVMLPQGIDGNGYDLDLLEAKDRSWEAFQGLIDRCDMSIVLPLLGQNLTTEVKEGSFAAARVHGDVRQNIVEADNAGLAHFIHTQIARPFALFNFGDADLAPWTEWDVQPSEDQYRLGQTLQAFGSFCEQLSRGGVQYDVEVIAKALGVPGIPKQPTPVFAQSAAAPPGGK